MMLEERLIELALMPTIQDLFKQNKPFLIQSETHELTIFPSEMIFLCEECDPDLVFQIDKPDHFAKNAIVLDWFEDAQNSSCTCPISSLMGNGCTCGAIVRYSK